MSSLGQRVCPRVVRLASSTIGRRRLAAAAAATSTTTSDHVRIVEVGPRDGLQNEKTSIPVGTKTDFVDRLATTGLEVIEAGSFVSPKWTPQMANSSDVLTHILERRPPSPVPITYQFLVPNEKGLDNFLDIRDKHSNASNIEVSIFTAATESFARKNTNCSIAESLQRFEPVVARARARGCRVRAYISVALGCPFEGPDVDPHAVAALAVSLLGMGADVISVADTTGMGTAPRTHALLRALAAAGVDRHDLALHLHDTYGMALVNALVGLEHGVRQFDAAVAGLGGCPFSPGATGNVATEDVVHLFESLGLRTGVDIEKLSEIGSWISTEIGRSSDSRVGKATLARIARDKEEEEEEH